MLRNTNTGDHLPQPENTREKKTEVEPTLFGVPMLFSNKSAATKFLKVWCKGIMNDWGSSRRVSNRRESDYEVVPVYVKTLN